MAEKIWIRTIQGWGEPKVSVITQEQMERIKANPGITSASHTYVEYEATGRSYHVGMAGIYERVTKKPLTE